MGLVTMSRVTVGPSASAGILCNVWGRLYTYEGDESRARAHNKQRLRGPRGRGAAVSCNMACARFVYTVWGCCNMRWRVFTVFSSPIVRCTMRLLHMYAGHLEGGECTGESSLSPHQSKHSLGTVAYRSTLFPCNVRHMSHVKAVTESVRAAYRLALSSATV